MKTPLVWTVTGYRAGEKTQIVALAEALGWPFVSKRIFHRRTGAVGQLLRRVTASGVDRERSSPLQPPWPDLVISAGLRNEPVCRWIRQQSGNRTRLVHVGRPWAPFDCFDLVITTPQYRLPDRPNILQNDLTLHRLTPERLGEAAREYEGQLEHLPRPLIAAIVGGNTGPYVFGRQAARRLARDLNRLVGDLGGSALVSTSARTPAIAAAELEASLTVPVDFYRWTADATRNPYYGFLALADSIVVTSDSIAMLGEACATGKPVYMFGVDPFEGNGVGGARDFRVSAWLYRQLMRWGPQRLGRDVGIVHRALEKSGRAAWMGDTFRDRRPNPTGDLDRAVRRVHQLLPEYACDAARVPSGGAKNLAMLDR